MLFWFLPTWWQLDHIDLCPKNGWKRRDSISPYLEIVVWRGWCHSGQLGQAWRAVQMWLWLDTQIHPDLGHQTSELPACPLAQKQSINAQVWPFYFIVWYIPLDGCVLHSKICLSMTGAYTEGNGKKTLPGGYSWSSLLSALSALAVSRGLVLTCVIDGANCIYVVMHIWWMRASFPPTQPCKLGFGPLKTNS